MRAIIVSLFLLTGFSAHAETVKPEIAAACEKVNKFMPLFMQRFGGDQELMTMKASCTPEGQAQMTRNDKLTISPTNSGNSAKWADSYFSRIATDGYLSSKK